jgi:membrane fusion protein, copper/silver efflux system
MKRNYIAKSLFFLLTTLFLFASCKSRSSSAEAATHQHHALQEYTCPMHPQIVQPKPGNCPICGMDLVAKITASNESGIDSSLTHLLKPVNEQVVAKLPTIRPEGGTRIFSKQVQGSITYDTRVQTSIASRVSGRIERLLIKYNYQPVRKGQLIMEIYSPDLAAAQRELLFIYQHDKNDFMLEKAKQRLLLLGMQPGQVQRVLTSKKILYRVPVYSNTSGYILEKFVANMVGSAAVSISSGGTPTGSGDGMGAMNTGGGSSSPALTSGTNANATSTTPVLVREGQYINAGQTLFTVYNDQSLVAEFALNPSLAAEVKKGQKLIFQKTADEQVVFTGNIGLIQPTFRAGSSFTIARVYIKDSRLRPGELVLANIPVVQHGWWVPEAAVLVLGNRSVVFKKEGEVFRPMPVNTKTSENGTVLIIDTVGDWEIASNASYLVDSESFIKVSGTNKTNEQ